MAIFDRNDPFQSYDFERNIILPYLKEYSNVTMFDRFTGGPDSVIFAKVSKAGQGDDIVYNQRQNFDPTVKVGNERLVEAEDELTYGVERLRVGFFRFGTRITNRQLQELQINHKFDPDIRSQLLWQGESLNSKRIMRQFGLAFSDNNRGNPNQQYNYADLIGKMLACGIDVVQNGEAVSRSRLMFGLDKGTNEATVGDTLTDGVLNSAVDDTLTANHIFKLASLAGKGSRTDVLNKETPIRPYTVGKNRMGFPDKKYLFLTSDDAFYKLAQDANWKAQQSRGTIENEEQPSILFGSNYKGTIHGVMVVTVPEFSNYVFANAGGTSYAYSALLGASAMGLGMGQIPSFAQETYDYGLYHGLAHIEVSDAKVLKFPSKTDLTKKGLNSLRVENGMIHSFVRLH
jgi:hypothetical protein